MRIRSINPIGALSLAFFLVLSACAPATPVIPQTGVEIDETLSPIVTADITEGTASPAETLEPTLQAGSPGDDVTPGEFQDQAGPRALGYLAEQLNLAENQLSVVEVSQQTWPDSCLGLGDTNELCSAAQVEGYRVVVERENGQWYVIRTDNNLDVMRVVFGNPGAPQDVVIPDAGETDIQDLQDSEAARTIAVDEAADIARRYLSRILGIPFDQIRVVETEEAEWSDVCLGTAAAGENCFQVPTSGYSIMLEANGQQYEVRTDLDATIRRLVDINQVQP